MTHVDQSIETELNDAPEVLHEDVESPSLHTVLGSTFSKLKAKQAMMEPCVHHVISKYMSSCSI